MCILLRAPGRDDTQLLGGFPPCTQGCSSFYRKGSVTAVISGTSAPSAEINGGLAAAHGVSVTR